METEDCYEPKNFRESELDGLLTVTKPKFVTVCLNCKHFVNLEPESVRKDVWYNHLCAANLLPTKINPYNGKEEPFGANDLGNEYFSDKPYEYCRNVNDGSCPSYEAKQT